MQLTDKSWMKWILPIIFFLLCSCAQVERRPSARNYHVVLDIDWTLVSEVKDGKLPSKRMIEESGAHYFVHEGLEDFVQNILDKKDVRISFYSGGSKLRNEALLSKIKLKSGLSLKDIAYKILNKEDLVSIANAPEGASFAERYKKDLSKVSKDLEQLIMFDDTAGFTYEAKVPQAQKVFHVGKAFNHYEKYEDARGLNGPYVPKSYEDWLLNRKKLYVLEGAFDAAYEESKSGEISFSEAMKKQEELLELEKQQWNETSIKYYKKYSGASLPVLLKGPECFREMKALMGL